jgi:O-antigen/teichoic acid export membrane protein
MIITATSQIPVYVLVSLHGTAQTGILGAAIQLTGVFHVFMTGIMNYCFPIAVHIHEQEERSALTRYTMKLIFYLFSAISFICIIFIIEAEEVVQFLYTDSFSSQGLWPFRILLAVGPVLAVIRPLDMMLRVRSQMKRRSYASIVELLFVAVAIFPAVSFFGALGAAYILVLGRLISVFVLAFIIWLPEIASSKLS